MKKTKKNTKVNKDKKKKLKSLKSLRKLLDKTFNTYIKERDKRCILSGTKEKLHCSHYYDKGASPYLRWDERNAHAMSSKMHFKHHHGKAPNYSLWMFKKYGIEYMEELYLDSEKPFVVSRDLYMNYITYYEQKRKDLKEKNNA